MYWNDHNIFTDWGDYQSDWITTNQIKCWFLVRGENGSAEWRTNKLSPYNSDDRSENRTQDILVEDEWSCHCVNPALSCSTLLFMVGINFDLQWRPNHTFGTTFTNCLEVLLCGSHLHWVSHGDMNLDDDDEGRKQWSESKDNKDISNVHFL